MATGYSVSNPAVRQAPALDHARFPACYLNVLHGCTACFDRVLEQAGIDLKAYLHETRTHRNKIQKQQSRLLRRLDPVLAAEDRAKNTAQVKAWNAAHPEHAKAIRKKASRKRLASGKEKTWRQEYFAKHPEKRKAFAQYVKRSRAKKPEYYRALDLANKHLRRANGGDFTPAQWEHMKDLYGHRCAYCDRHMERLTMDHVIPVSQGGEHTWNNIVPACRRCNSSKHTKPAPTHQMVLRFA